MALHEGLRPHLKPLLAQVGDGVHPGLWLDRFLGQQTSHRDRKPPGYDEDSARGARDRLVSKIDEGTLATGYRFAYEQWRAGLRAEGAPVCIAEAASLGRIVIGVGQKNPAEFGITLHRTWGVPILPGSSLKGIASLGADRYLEGDTWRRRENAATARADGPNAFDALFGDVEEQGAVIFHDAWYVPPLSNKNGLHRDVLTVHHPDYYQREGALSDTESPNPVPFMSAKGSFLIALELSPALNPAEHGHWLEAAWEALRLGLSRHGVGAKTNAGYGRVELPAFGDTDKGKAAIETRAAAERETAERELAERMAAMNPSERVTEFLNVFGGPALIAWLKSNGQTTAPGLHFDEAHVAAAKPALHKLNLTKGLQSKLEGNALDWWMASDQAAAPANAAPTPHNNIPQSQLEAIFKAWAKKPDWDRFTREVQKLSPDDDSLVRAAALLSGQPGVKDGHINSLLRLKQG